MTKREVKKLPKNTVEVIVTVPWDVLQKEQEGAFKRLSEKLEAPGYRQGKAPKEVARKHISADKAYEEALRTLLPSLYEEIVKEENIRPIANPKIELVAGEENTDWKIKFTIPEKPEVTLGDYKEKIQKLKKEAKAADIWVPGRDAKKPTAEDEAQRQKLLNDILELLLREVACEVPDLITEEEVNQRLTRLVDDVQRLGMTIDGYAKSKNTSVEELKASYQKEAENTYRLEFILAEVADKEGIKVEKEELDKIFSGIKDEGERKKAEESGYFYASVLRKQKTIDFLMSL